MAARAGWHMVTIRRCDGHHEMSLWNFRPCPLPSSLKRAGNTGPTRNTPLHAAAIAIGWVVLLSGNSFECEPVNQQRQQVHKKLNIAGAIFTKAQRLCSQALRLATPRIPQVPRHAGRLKKGWWRGFGACKIFTSDVTNQSTTVDCAVTTLTVL